MIATVTLIDLAEAKQWLHQQLSSSTRFDHSMGAYDKAVELAEKFHLPHAQMEKAAVAGLLHDAAKLMNPGELIRYCEEHGLAIDAMDRATPQTLHPFVGAELVRERFGLHDEETLDAIRFHTTGRAGMSPVEKIVYIADKIEENTRNPLFVKRVAAHLDERILHARAFALSLAAAGHDGRHFEGMQDVEFARSPAVIAVRPVADQKSLPDHLLVHAGQVPPAILQQHAVAPLDLRLYALLLDDAAEKGGNLKHGSGSGGAFIVLLTKAVPRWPYRMGSIKSGSASQQRGAAF